LAITLAVDAQGHSVTKPWREVMLAEIFAPDSITKRLHAISIAYFKCVSYGVTGGDNFAEICTSEVEKCVSPIFEASVPDLGK
jgi:hypothetical protein